MENKSYSYKEIAKELHTSQESVRRIEHKALIKLRMNPEYKILREYLLDEPYRKYGNTL